jgi:hypothetical protein
LLLRTDIHRLFDLGYVTVSPEGRFEVSSRLKADFDNGRHYHDLQGTPVRPPRYKVAIPSAEALAWHREHRYLGCALSCDRPFILDRVARRVTIPPVWPRCGEPPLYHKGERKKHCALSRSTMRHMHLNPKKSAYGNSLVA